MLARYAVLFSDHMSVEVVCGVVRRLRYSRGIYGLIGPQVELDSIQDYVAESDNLVALQQQIRGCDCILEKMESLLGGFQADLGKISSEASDNDFCAA